MRFVSPTKGKRRDLGLGTYPATGIALARRLGTDARTLIAEGKDPIEARRVTGAEKQTARNDMTFREAALAVHAELKVGFRNPKHAAQWITTLETYVFPVIGNRLVSELRAADFVEALRPIWLAKAETAARTKQRCDAVMTWCAARDMIVAQALSGSLITSYRARRASANGSNISRVSAGVSCWPSARLCFRIKTSPQAGCFWNLSS